MICILILVWRHYMHMTRKKKGPTLPAEVEEAVVWEQIQLNSVQQSWQGRWRDAYNLCAQAVQKRKRALKSEIK